MRLKIAKHPILHQYKNNFLINLQKILRLSVPLFAIQVFSYLLNVFTSNIFDKSAYSEISAILALQNVLITLAFGIQIVFAQNFISSLNKKNVSELNVFESMWKVSLIAIFSIFFTIVILRDPLNLETFTFFIGLISIVPQIFSSSVIGIYQSVNELNRVALTIMLSQIPKLILSFVVLSITENKTYFLVSIFVGNFIGAVLCIQLLKKNFSFKNTKGLIKFWKKYLAAIFATAGFNLFVNFDVLVARWLLAPNDAGIYAIGTLVSKIAFFFPSAIAVLSLANFRGSESGARRKQRAILAIIIINSPLIIVSFFSPKIILSLLGQFEVEQLSKNIILFALAGTGYSIIQITSFENLSRSKNTITLFLLASIFLASLMTYKISLSSTTQIILLINGLIALILVLETFATKLQKSNQFNE